MANDLLVLVETKAGKIKKSSLELLSEGGKIAGKLGGQVKALLVGPGVSALAPETGAYGANEAYVCEEEGVKTYNPQVYAHAVAEACKTSQASLFLATASSTGRDLLPRVAARLNTGMVSEAVALSVRDGKVVARRPMYAGKCMVEATSNGSLPQVITCRANVFEVAAPDASKKAKVTKLEANLGSVSPKARIVEVIQGKSDRPDLTEAAIIVSGGRSIKAAENFKILYELADVLGAAVGASRAAVDAGYAPHDMQVGQTGKTVNPSLYIACGISGAIQHLAGMRTSKVIVAVNTDPEAPIFQKADYGIVGDLFQAVPKLTEAFRKLLKE